MMRTFTAYVELDPETGTYFGMIPGIPGAHTQGDNLDELRANLKEVLELCLEEYEGVLPHFVGVLEIEVEPSDEALR
jgi:predicted RNase H-like HicB family nuclease